jgi:hypothetical protein
MNNLLKEFNDRHNRISIGVNMFVPDYDYFEPPPINPEEKWTYSSCQQSIYDVQYHEMYRHGILKLLACAQDENYTMCRFGVVLEQAEEREDGICRQVIENFSGQLMRLETKGEDVLRYVHANAFSIDLWHLKTNPPDLQEIEHALLASVGEDDDLTLHSCIEGTISLRVVFEFCSNANNKRRYLETWDLMAKVLKDKFLK